MGSLPTPADRAGAFPAGGGRASGIDLDEPGTASRVLVVTVAVSTAVIVVVGVLTLLRSSVQWPTLPGFTWAYVMAFLFADAITAVLLLRFERVQRSRSLAVLASAYVFSALVSVSFFLAFPGSVTDGVLLGGAQSAIWQYYLWRTGFALLVTASSLLLAVDVRRARAARWWPWAAPLAGGVLAGGVALVALGLPESLPVLIRPGQPEPLTTGFYLVSLASLAACLAALASTLWAARHGSRLRVWLVLVSVLITADVAIQMAAGDRYTVGWYVPRILGIAANAVLLVLLVAEVARQSRTLADSLDRQDEMWELVQAAPDGFLVVDAAGRITWANGRAEELFGFPGGLTGHAVEELVPEQRRRDHRAHREAFQSAAHRGETRAMSPREVVARRGDGTRFPVRIGLTTVVTRSGPVTAVNAQEPVPAAVDDPQGARERARLEEVVDSAGIGYLTFGPDLRILAANRALAEMTGYGHDELLGLPVLALQGDDRDTRTSESLRQILDGSQPRLALRVACRRKDGDLLWVDATAHALTDAHGHVAGVSVSLVDVTVEVAAEATEHASIGVAVTDLDGTVVHLNEALSEMLGRSRVDLVGRVFADLLDPDDRPVEALQRAQLVEGVVPAVALECQIAVPGRGRIWVNVHRGLMRDGESVTGLSLQVIDVTAQKDAEAAVREVMADLDYRSRHDVLTGLLNRGAFHARLEELVADCPPGLLVGVLFADVDAFKQINDAVSHSQGDAVLQQVAHVLRRCVRTTDVVARLGGDEFAVALPGLHDVAAAGAVADKIVRAVAASSMGGSDRPLPVTLSIGVTVSHGDRGADELLQEADVAMYRAKQEGRNRWQLFSRAMRTDLVRRLELAQRMREGIEAGEFRAWYQPVVDLASGDVVGYEALARWLPRTGEPVPAEAETFIDVAEETGLVVPLGRAVIRDALRTLTALPGPLTMAVNVSPTQLLAEDFVPEFLADVEASGADPSRLVVEITEQALLRAGALTRDTLAELVGWGIGLHVDDFGTGFSSLSHLRDHPVTGIKLDRSFTALLTTPHDRVAELAAGIAGLARRLGLARVAEGVETEAQRRMLVDLGWSQAQGYLFGAAAAEPARVAPVQAIPDVS